MTDRTDSNGQTGTTEGAEGTDPRLEEALRQGGSGERGASARNSSTSAADAAQRLSARIAAEGLADVTYAPADSPFGPLLLAATGRGIVRVGFPRKTSTRCSQDSRGGSRRGLCESSAPLESVQRELEEYFTGRRRSFELALDWTLVGAFGRKVLRATLRSHTAACSATGRSPPRPAARAAHAPPATPWAPTRSRS